MVETSDVLDLALKQDVGMGDITSSALIDSKQKISASVIALEDGVLAGMQEARYIFRKLGKVRVDAKKRDGDPLKKGQTLLVVEGNARAILAAERTVLNVLSRMSAIATVTRKMGKYTTIAATRKTAPGCLLLDKKAVKIGGGMTHRLGLWDRVLIKDTHLDAMYLPEEMAIERAIERCSRPLEIEVQNERQALIAAGHKPNVIMLDNFTPAQAKNAIAKIRKVSKRIKIELSGGITPKNIRQYAKVGADYISMGCITNFVIGLNIHMKVRYLR